MTTQRLRSIAEFVFPIKKNELLKFSLLSLLMLGILYIHVTLRSMKDSIIVPNIGAESLSFIDLYLVLPVAMLFTLAYTKVSSILSSDKVFYCVKLLFLSFFTIFILLIYPNTDILHPDPARVEELIALYPSLKWMLRIYGKWTFALFAIFVDLWGPTVTVLSYWQFANSVTSSDEARRMYPTLALLGNFALISAGAVVKNSAAYVDNVISFNVTIVIFMIMVNMTTYYAANKLLEIDRTKIRGRNPVSTLKSIKIVMGSKYLLYIFIMVVAYGSINNMIEAQWKANIREMYPDQKSYAAFFGGFTQYMGYSSMVIMLFGSQILRRLGWRAAAMTTPIVIIITSSIFFTVLLNRTRLDHIALDIFGCSTTQLIIYVGMMQVMLMKAAKYGLFDPTKEMAFIVADEELKTKGKAAVDVVGMRLSDTTGAFSQSIMYMFFGHALAFGTSFSVMIMVFCIALAWIYSASSLGKIYNKIIGCENKPNQ